MVSDHVPGEDLDGEPERQRLHRRDTPHHLKNKRINQQVSWIFLLFTISIKLMSKDNFFKHLFINNFNKKTRFDML